MWKIENQNATISPLTALGQCKGFECSLIIIRESDCYIGLKVFPGHF